MRVEDLKLKRIGGKTRAIATFTWEDRDCPPQDIYFETDDEFADQLSCNPNAFLTASILPALRHGERRIRIDGTVCPELRYGLETAIALHQHWSGGYRAIPQIEARINSAEPDSLPEKRAGFFFSGGVDSFATLRFNRLSFPLEHPGSLKDGLLVYGMNVESDPRLETFHSARRSLTEAALGVGITLIPIYTNVRTLDLDPTFFVEAFHGPILFSVAHVFASRFGSVTIASTFDIPNLAPLGSHPLLDSNFSSFGLRIRHDGITLSRLAKTKLISDWKPALNHLRVCAPNWPGENCGQCRKCISTMLALEVLGVLSETAAFPINRVSEELVASIPIYDLEQAVAYSELRQPLRDIGRLDLLRSVERALQAYRGEAGWKGRLKYFDRTHLGGTLVAFKKALRAISASKGSVRNGA